MFNLNKESGDYLKQIRNNIPEKISLLKRALDSGELPWTADGKMRIVELGIGGGESLKELREQTDGREDVELLAVDIMPKLVASLKNETGLDGVAADAGALPFKDGSVSAVNASAIFHEVSSYGTRRRSSGMGKTEIIFGREAVLNTLEELNRILIPGGQLAYRDVLAPSGDLSQLKTARYFHKSWRSFAGWFMEDFLHSNLHYHEEKEAVSSETVDGLSLTASVGLQREFQRHYLMFRDFLRNCSPQDFGVSIHRSDWLDMNKGLKTVTFSLDERLAAHLDLSSLEGHNSAEGLIYRSDSDRFDKIYDDIIEHYFSELRSGSDIGQKFRKLIGDWKEREGLEHYIYGNIGDMLNLSCDASDSTDSHWILFPESSKDIVVAPRFYYNRYLKQVIDEPEKDGKQMISFKKMTREQARQSLEAIGFSSLAENGGLDSAKVEQLRRRTQAAAESV